MANERQQALIDMLLRIGALLGLIAWCALLLAPFVTIIAWGLIIAVTLHPAQTFLTRKLGGRRVLSAVLLTLAGFLVIVLPGYLLADSLVQAAKTIRVSLGEGPVQVPPPDPAVRDWPFVGSMVHSTWETASHSLRQALELYEEQLTTGGKWLLKVLGRFGRDVLEFLIALLLSGLLLANAPATGRVGRAFFKRLLDQDGRDFTRVAERTVRSVAVGIIGIAVLQTALASIGFIAAGVPLAGIWTVLCLFLTIIQVGMFPVIVPVIIYMFYTADPTTATLLTIWLLLVGLTDNLLRPFALGMGAPAPFFIVFVGAIGGFFLSGLIGLFVGAVVLSLGYRLFMAWLGPDALPPKELQEKPGS